MADILKLVSGGDDVKIWEPPNLRLVETLKPHTSQAVTSLAWSPNNHLLASTAPGEQIVVTSFKGATPNSVVLPGCEDETCLTFNSSSRHLLTGGKSKILNLWDLKTRTVKKKIKNHKDPINCVTFNWNDTNIASGSTTGDILVHNVSTTQTSVCLRFPNTQTIHALHYSRFRKALLGSVSDDGAMNIWDTNTKKIFASFSDQHRAPAMDICFSPMNDMLLASVGLDKKIIFYDIQGKKVIKEMATESPLTSISFMQDGAAFVVGSTRGKMYVYDLRSGSTPQHCTPAHKSAVHCLSFQLSPKGNSSASSTLAEKFTSRSSSDSSKVNTHSLHSGGDLEKVTSESVQNGLKNNDSDGAIFSPLREGLGSNNTLEKPTREKEYDQLAGSSKKIESISVSGIFSPVGSSTQTSQEPASKPTHTFLTNSRDLNGYPVVPPPVKEGLQRPSKPPVTMTTSTPRIQNPSRENVTSVGNKITGTLTFDKNKAFSSPPLSTDKQSVTTNSRTTKTTSSGYSPTAPSSQMPVENERENENASQQKVSNLTSLTAGDMKSSSSNMVAAQEATNGSIQSTDTHGESSAGLQQFQIQFMKNLIDDALDEFRINFHRDIVNLQVEMLRQFEIQQNETRALLQQYSLNDALVAENERLKEENRKLKATH